MAITNHERVGKAMDLLRGGDLRPSWNASSPTPTRIARLARDGGKASAEQGGLFGGDA